MVNGQLDGKYLDTRASSHPHRSVVNGRQTGDTFCEMTHRDYIPRGLRPPCMCLFGKRCKKKKKALHTMKKMSIIVKIFEFDSI